MSKIFVVVLIGLPGAGKTTFCQEILKFATHNVIHVCFDNYIKVEKDVSLYTRKDLINEIENLIKSIKTSNVVTSLFLEASNLIENNCKYLILVDDNNYYRGMRYRFYKICKSIGTVFVQIYFSIPLSTVLERNRNRKTGFIPEDVINSMNTKLEVPSKKSNWENYTMYVNNEGNIDIKQVISYIEGCPCVSIFKTKQSTAFNQNITHEIDIALRRHVKYLVSINKEKTTKECIEIKAKTLNSKRKTLLSDLRRGALNLDDDNLIDILKCKLQDVFIRNN